MTRTTRSAFLRRSAEAGSSASWRQLLNGVCSTDATRPSIALPTATARAMRSVVAEPVTTILKRASSGAIRISRVPWAKIAGRPGRVCSASGVLSLSSMATKFVPIVAYALGHEAFRCGFVSMLTPKRSTWLDRDAYAM